jgi:hypothetical protein
MHVKTSARAPRVLRRVLAADALTAGMFVPLASAQESSGPGPTAAPPSTAPPDASGALVAIVVFTVLLAVIALGVKILDLRRRREAEAVYVQAQVSDALLRDPRFFELAITPTAHAPVWKGTPVTVELSGEVPTPALRDSALSLVKREASRVRPDVRIEDRLSVVPGRGLRTA